MKIAIVGAGVSGIILGSLLKKNINCELTIFEKRSKIFDNTNGIQLSPNSIIRGLPVGISNSLIFVSEILNKYLHKALSEFP